MGRSSIDLNSLVVFVHVVEANSFSGAARILKMPTSTVSRRVAELEDQLGMRLIERSTRRLRLTDSGSEVLEHSRRIAELRDTVDSAASNLASHVSGTLRLAAPPSISDTLLAPIVGAFQEAYPEVRVQIFITDRIVDHVSEGVDVTFRVGDLEDSSLVARKNSEIPASACRESGLPEETQSTEESEGSTATQATGVFLLEACMPVDFVHGRDKETLTFHPYLSMNDYAGLATALLAGVGIGDLPPLVQPGLLREGQLVEIMPKWKFRNFDLSLVHAGSRQVPRVVRVFKEFAAKMATQLFPQLPT